MGSLGVDLTGRRFGRWLMLSFAGRNGRKQAHWRCRCDCGREVTVAGSNLGRGSRSCGCSDSPRHLTHGHTVGRSQTGAYASWKNMWARVRATSGVRWRNYGSRGITACERWLSFENFFADMGSRPAGASIDRIDNDGNYEPGNCRWATSKQQARNQRVNRLLSFDGEALHITDWSQRTGIPASTISRRMGRGWSPERVLAR